MVCRRSNPPITHLSIKNTIWRTMLPGGIKEEAQLGNGIRECGSACGQVVYGIANLRQSRECFRSVLCALC